MNADEIIKYLEYWAPPGAAWDRDNVGLQTGSRETKVQNVFLCLELNQKALNAAIKNNCNFIFTHHPLIFKPIKSLNFQNDPKAQLIQQLIKNNITVYSAHTNLDFTKGGVSFELAKMLSLKDVDFLYHEDENQYKISVFVPESSVDSVAKALFESGCGQIGEYENCSFRTPGKGSFKGSGNANPVIGKKENFEIVNEIKLEVIVDSWSINKAVSAIRKVHPYEEPAYDIYPLKNKNINFGAGAIGNLETTMDEEDFLLHVKTSLNAGGIRYTTGKSKKIRKVAVCGGNGSDLVGKAIASKADAFITADIKYHTFQDAEESILLIDAGHYETEIHSLNEVKTRIDKLIKEKKEKIKVYKYNGTTNPVKFY